MKTYFSLFAILFLFFGCGHPEDPNLFWVNPTRPRSLEAYFSFPGRYVSNSKKRNVRDQILSLIEEADHSIDLWIYSFDDPEILEALVRAEKRGVRLQIVADPEKVYPDDLVRLGLFRRWERSGLQHSKILIIDRKEVFLGSGNFTWYGLENDLNGYLLFSLFETEISDFYSFLEEDPRFPSLAIPPFLFYISPDKGRLIQNLLLREVDKTKNSIRYLIFDHFDSVLSSRLSLADRKGVVVQGVYDTPVDGEGKFLANVLIQPDSKILGDGNDENVSTDSFGKGGLLHHKTMILDETTLLSGSFNFSVSARDNNREILFRTNDSYLLREFKEEWNRVLQQSIPYPSSFPKQNVSINPIGFRYSEDSLPNGIEQNLCRETFENEESLYLESGSAFLKSILEYDFDPGERCKTVSDFSSGSSGFTGRKTNHPVKTPNFRRNSRLLSKNGFLLRESGDTETNKPNFGLKPVFLFMPDLFSVNSGNLLLPDSLFFIENPLRVFYYQRGEGPALVVWNRIGSFLNIPALLNEGMIFLEFESAFYSFCFHERSKKGTEYTELINEILSFRVSELTTQKLPEEKTPIQRRKESGSFCYQY
ncbi:PLD-like domain protein [Leptospira sp. 201903071]|uniref:phospholipase D-like domain-containing protein n=1 Tax=Leptospira ainazelensis TaxID=2810034 RepID=UPI001964DE9F|nr:phospholipase D-like domain-containing protein [Leptospira ainazelensis]MBM9501763.1 PLD-like domain protein [Leptospira ainazelensis]